MSSAPEASTHLVVYVSFGEADCPCGIPHSPLYSGSVSAADRIILDPEGPPPKCPVLINQKEKAKRKRVEEERERQRELKLIRQNIRMRFQPRRPEMVVWNPKVHLGSKSGVCPLE